MDNLSRIKVGDRWPAAHPNRLQLYSALTPNGVKVSLALEETGVPYEAHFLNFANGDTRTPEFLSLNPNGKIPAILDPDGPGGKPLALSESGAIVMYVAEKTGKLLPKDTARRHQALEWVFFGSYNMGPMFTQFGFFYKLGGREIEDKRPLERYAAETRRLLGVLEARLTGRQWIMDDEYTVADIINFPFMRTLMTYYDATDYLQLHATYPNVMAWLDRAVARPASQRGLIVPVRPAA